jgi:hypothetical protein
MTDFRALCQELASLIQTYPPTDTAYWAGRKSGILQRARAALDEPEGEGPDHASLIAFAYGREPWATWLKIGGCLESAHCELSDLMTDVLARWGRPAASAPSEAAWALAQLLDGVQRHDLQSMTGLSDRDCDRIWAALDEPEMEGPSDQELERFLADRHRARMESESAFGCPDFDGAKARAARIADAHAVLARWGNSAAPAPKPIPVSERP